MGIGREGKDKERIERNRKGKERGGVRKGIVKECSWERKGRK